MCNIVHCLVLETIQSHFQSTDNYLHGVSSLEIIDFRVHETQTKIQEIYLMQ